MSSLHQHIATGLYLLWPVEVAIAAVSASVLYRRSKNRSKEMVAIFQAVLLTILGGSIGSALLLLTWSPAFLAAIFKTPAEALFYLFTTGVEYAWLTCLAAPLTVLIHYWDKQPKPKPLEKITF